MPELTNERTVVVVLLAGALGGCGRSELLEALPLAGAAGFESPSSAAPDSTGGISVVRPLDVVHGIEHIALSGDYLFFSSNWNGVYRVPKTGGAVEVVEEDHSAVFTALTANSSEVLWERVRFDGQGYPYRTFLRRSTSLGPVATIVASDQFDSLDKDGLLPADDAHVIVRHLQDQQAVAISLSDATMVQVPTADSTMSTGFEDSGAFVLAGDTLFSEFCAANSCELVQGKVTTGLEEMGISMSWVPFGNGTGAPLAGVDEEHLYFFDLRRAWRLLRSDYTSVDIYRAPDDAFLQGPFAVDSSDVYFVTSDGKQDKLVAAAKAGQYGGGVRVLSTGRHLKTGPCEIAQDEQNLFVLALTEDSDEILVVAKH